MRNRGVHRRGRLPIVAVGLVVALVMAGVWLGRRERARVLAGFERSAVGAVGSLARALEEAIEAGVEDVRLLANSPAARDVVAGAPAADARLEALFTAYARARRGVFQVRLLGPDGRERVRVERTSAGVAPARTLQSKAGRYYFQAARDLAAGEVYVSRLDLNVEHGRVERPPRPAIRFATALRDASGALAGVVIINREGEWLLDAVRRARERLTGTLVLVDADGNYLSHPDPAREWGGPAMLGTGHGLRRDDPALAGWALGDGGGASWRGPGLIAARAVVGASAASPRVLLVTTEAAALASEARAFIPLIVGLGSAAVLVAIVLVALWRQDRLARELARESELRRAIASREHRLREAQERLVASARLAALTESAAALAHEIRNPLGAIVTSAAQLRGEPTLDPDARELLEIVLGESERLERTVSDFLALARRPAPRPEPVDLGALAREVVALARRDPAFADGLEPEVESAPGMPAVRADPDEIRQVLWNLLLNAASANRRAGGRRVRVAARPATIDGRPAAALEVEDEGPGPPPPDGAPDARADRSGLGLIVVAGVAARYGGAFVMAPRPGGGTRAAVLLPAPP